MSFANLAAIANADQQNMRPGKFGTTGSYVPSLFGPYRQVFSPWYMPAHQNWKVGTSPGTGSGAICDNTTDGGMPYAQPAGGGNLFITKFDLGHQYGTSGAAGMVLFDRIWHNSGYIPTDGGTKTVNSTALPARANSGIGCWLFMEIQVSLGTTTLAPSVTYTNTADAGSRSATLQGPMHASYNAPYMTHIFSLQQGDLGIKSIQSVSFTTSGSASGRFGFVIAKPICVISKVSVHPAIESRDVNAMGALEIALPPIPAGACLWPHFEYTNVYGNNYGDLQLAET